MNGNGDVHLQQQHHQHRVQQQQQPRNTTSKNNINNKNFNSSKVLSKKPVMKGHPPDKSKILPINNKVKGQQQNQAKPLMNLPPATLPQPQPQPLMEVKKHTFEPITIPNEVEENSIPSKGNLKTKIRIRILCTLFIKYGFCF